MICHTSKLCHRARTSSCHKEQRGYPCCNWPIWKQMATYSRTWLRPNQTSYDYIIAPRRGLPYGANLGSMGRNTGTWSIKSDCLSNVRRKGIINTYDLAIHLRKITSQSIEYSPQMLPTSQTPCFHKQTWPLIYKQQSHIVCSMLHCTRSFQLCPGRMLQPASTWANHNLLLCDLRCNVLSVLT